MGILCFSHGGQIEGRARNLPWDTDSPEQICGACYRRYSRSKTRCLSCKYMVTTAEFKIQAAKGLLRERTVGKDGRKEKFYTCIKCNQEAVSLVAK